MEKNSNQSGIKAVSSTSSNKPNQDVIIDLTPINKASINAANLEKSRQYVIKNNYWNERHEKILEGLQKNTNKFYREYQKAHLIYKKKLRLYRIPIIILSSLGGFLSISNSGYIPVQFNKWVSLLVGFVNLVMTMVSLIENFKKIDVNVNKTYTAYIEFKKLHDEISLILNTPREERDTNGYDMVLTFFNRYEAYLSDAPILSKIVHDYLDNNSPDNNTQTLMISGSADISEGQLDKENQENDNISKSSSNRKRRNNDIDEDLSEYNSVLSHYEEIDDIEAPSSPVLQTRKDKMRKFLENTGNISVKKSNLTGKINKTEDVTDELKQSIFKKNVDFEKKINNNLTNIAKLSNTSVKAEERIQKVNKFQEQINKMKEEIMPQEKSSKLSDIENKLSKGPELKNFKISEDLKIKMSNELIEEDDLVINLKNISEEDIDEIDDKQEIEDKESSSSSS